MYQMFTMLTIKRDGINALQLIEKPHIPLKLFNFELITGLRFHYHRNKTGPYFFISSLYWVNYLILL